MIKRALNINEEKVLVNKTLQCLDVRNVYKRCVFCINIFVNVCVIQQKDTQQKSRATLGEDEALEWLKPRTLLKPDDQEDVPEAVSY